jgi:hypothetical protein
MNFKMIKGTVASAREVWERERLKERIKHLIGAIIEKKE